jgi:hypothetical protein
VKFLPRIQQRDNFTVVLSHLESNFMTKRALEEDNSTGFLGKITLSLCAAFKMATEALGIYGSEIPPERESTQNEVTVEQTQSIVNENKQKNESRNKTPITAFRSGTRNNPSSNRSPISQINNYKAQQEEEKYIARIYSNNLLTEGLENGSPCSSSCSDRKISNYLTHPNTPFKLFGRPGESSTKNFTPREDSSDSEIEIIGYHQNAIDVIPEDGLKRLRDMVSMYNDKNNLLIEARLKRSNEVEKRMARKFLTEEQETKVKQIYKERDDGKIYVTIKNIDIKYDDLLKISPGQWLNDELINCYMILINEECAKNPQYPRVHCFNTFFYVMLLNNGKGYNYQRVAKWTKSFDIFALDFIIAPIHVGGNHWCLAVINVKDKQFEYYDSMGGDGASCIMNLKFYIADEHKNKKGTEIDLSDWKTFTPRHSIPQQNNVHDCGVFMCQFAESICSGNSIEFVNQADMPYYRKRMMLEILNNNRHFDDDKFISSRLY